VQIRRVKHFVAGEVELIANIGDVEILPLILTRFIGQTCTDESRPPEEFPQ
jgi:hypothetical protein